MDENLQHRLRTLRDRIARACVRAGRDEESVRVVVVTKTHPPEVVQAVIDAGIRDIGENRVQEIVQKAPLLSGERCLHMVGHLQTNKVGKVVPLVDWVQSLDSERLLQKIELQCERLDKKLNALVQVNTSGEDSKSGCEPGEALELCEKVAESPRVELRGLMTIGPLDADERRTRQAFATLRELGQKCQRLCGTVELSMGMSGDFEWAIEEGASMIRVGSLVLGERPSD